jgi:hypothetical protein
MYVLGQNGFQPKKHRELGKYGNIKIFLKKTVFVKY